MAAATTRRSKTTTTTTKPPAAVHAPKDDNPPFVDPRHLRQQVLKDAVLATEHFIVEAAHLRAVMGAMAVKDVRYYLNGLYLDIEAQRLVATNGHVMAHCPAWIDREIHRPLIDRLIWERGRPGPTRKQGMSRPDQIIFRPEKAVPPSWGDLLSVDLSLGRIWRRDKPMSGDLRIAAFEDGLYPAWQRVVCDGQDFTHEQRTETRIGINPSLLARIWDGPVEIRMRSSHENVAVRLMRNPDSKSPQTDMSDVRVTLMPVRL